MNEEQFWEVAVPAMIVFCSMLLAVLLAVTVL